MVEIQHPDVPDHRYDSPGFWGRWPSIRFTWLRHVAPQLGIDPSRIIYVEVIDNIISDDENGFMSKAGGFNPALAPLGRVHLLARLDSEIDTPEIPMEIHKKLDEVRLFVRQRNWSNQEDYDQSYSLWRAMRDYVEKFAEADEKLDMDRVYRHYWREDIQPLWSHYIGTSQTA